MRILFDNGTPRGVAHGLTGHTVEECRAHGWDTLRNGELLDAAEAARFDVLLTTDRNIRYKQNLTHRTIAIVILGKGRWRLIKNRLSIARVIEPAVATNIEPPERVHSARLSLGLG